MKRVRIEKGLDLPMIGPPEASLMKAAPVRHVALVGDDYIGMKPTMLVGEGDRVACGTPLFSDKKNEGVIFTAPAAGEVTAINRGAKRKFESLVIRVEGSESLSFCEPETSPAELGPAQLRDLLVSSGMWCSFRTRPYGKVPAIASEPESIFITAMDSSPLGPDLKIIIDHQQEDFLTGMRVLAALVDKPLYLCHAGNLDLPERLPDKVEQVVFEGPHPSGLPSTHIHFIDPVHETRTVWHIGAQDVCAIGGLLRTGRLCSERIVALGGSSLKKPRHVETILGASITELCENELVEGEAARLLSGSVLDGRQASAVHGFLGRYHQQISCLPEGDGRQLFGWLRPGGERFSVTRAFLSAFTKPDVINFNTAIWGGTGLFFLREITRK